MRNIKLTKGNQFLAALLVIQLIVGVVILRPIGATGATSSGPLLADFKPEDVTGLTVSDNSKNQVVLTKQADGTWVIPKYDNFPANASQITTFLGKVAALDTSRLVAENPANHNRLHVSDDTFERIVDIKRGDKTDRLYVGTTSGASATYMRINSDNQVYLTNGLSEFEISGSVASWINTSYVSLTQSDIIELHIKNDQGDFDITNTNGTWVMAGTPAGQAISQDKVSTLLNQIASLSMAAPLGKTPQDRYAMNVPLADITVITKSTGSGSPTPTQIISGILNVTPTAGLVPSNQAVQTPHNVVIGAKLDSGNYAAKASDSAYFAEIASGVAESFTNLKLTDLLVVLPTATSNATTFPTLTPLPTLNVTNGPTLTPLPTNGPTLTPLPSLTPLPTATATPTS